MTGSPNPYDVARAASYWSGPRHERGDELAAVLSLGEPPAVNEAYDAWEAALVLDAFEGRNVERALDLGAGVGRIAVRVASRVGRVICGDLAPGMLARLRRNAAGFRLTNVDPIRIRSDQLPFRNGSFHGVLCLGLLEHLPPHARSETLAEAARVLRPGGFLAVVINNPESRFLQDPRDNPHRDATQHESGYYCSVVPEEAVLAQAARDFDDRVLGSNLFYSLQRHGSRVLPEAARNDVRLRPFFQCAARWDAAIRPSGVLARAAADHHIHLLVRR